MVNPPSADQLAQIPRLYETEEIPLKDKIIHLHLFLFSCDWYLVEYDGEDLFFGFAILSGDHQNSEWGYLSFKELKSLSYKGFEVELDEYWEVKRAGDVPNIKV